MPLTSSEAITSTTSESWVNIQQNNPWNGVKTISVKFSELCKNSRIIQALFIGHLLIIIFTRINLAMRQIEIKFVA